MAWTTADLLSLVRNQQMIPDASSGSLGDAVLLEHATGELYTTVLPVITGLREKYYETYSLSNYSNLNPSVPIPSRAIGGGITLVQFIYNNSITRLDPIDPARMTTTNSAPYPVAYYFENNNVVFYPPPSSAQGQVSLRYLQRPSRLDLISNCAQITAFDPITFVVTFTTIPSTWTTSNTFDFVPSDQTKAMPYGIDSAITAYSATTLTFTSLPTTIKVGDWVALSNFTPIPEMPFEFQHILATATAIAALLSQKDPAYDKTVTRLETKLAAAIKLLTPRDQEGSKKVVTDWWAW